MQEYTITNVQPRSEWRSQYAKTPENDMMDYAIALEGESGWTKLTQRLSTQPPTIGQKLSGSIETKFDKNGQEYRKFKKQDPKFSQPEQTTSNPKEDYIVMMLEELTGRREVTNTVSNETPVDDDPFGGL